MAATITGAKLSAQEIESVDVSKLEPQSIIEAIRSALAVGAHMQARRLATQGASLYPDHTELAKMAYILARPIAVRRKGEPDNSTRANQLWLIQNYEEYKDKWVALRSGELVAVAETAKALKAKVPDLADMMVTRV